MSGFKGFRIAEKPVDWCRNLRDIPVSSMAKLVGHVLAMHINFSDDHKDTRISVMRLAFETGTSKRTVIRALTELRQAGLIYVMERGSNLGRQATASRYVLTGHDGMDAMRADYKQWLAQHEPPAPPSAGAPERVPA